MFTKSDLYWHSPKSLLTNSENCPVQKIIDINKGCKNEYHAECTTNFVKNVNSKNYSCFIENLIKIESFSLLIISSHLLCTVFCEKGIS